MDGPEPAIAPVIPPVFVPMVQVKSLEAEAVNAIFGLVPLHMVAVFVFVTAGFGCTVTVIVDGVPAQVPVIEVGVTM